MERMNFEEFVTEIKERIKDFLPESFQKAEICLQAITKNNNMKLTGLTIRNVGSNMVPTIYLEQFYTRYQKGEEMSELLRRIAQIRVENDKPMGFDTEQIVNFDKAHDKIMPQLISAKLNKESLNERPHILIEDLAVVFCIILQADDEGTANVQVSNHLKETWQVTTEELYDLAIKNLVNADAGIFVSMKEVLSGLSSGLYGEDLRTAEDMLECSGMYVVSNKEKVHGAAIILNQEMMNRIVEKMGDGFYILPSSVHECLLLPADVGIDAKYLESMVQQVNAKGLNLQERLSDHVYQYFKEKGIKRVRV